MAKSEKRIQAIIKNSSETGEVAFKQSVLILFPQSVSVSVSLFVSSHSCNHKQSGRLVVVDRELCQEE